jgi:hypothetical protein
MVLVQDYKTEQALLQLCVWLPHVTHLLHLVGDLDYLDDVRDHLEVIERRLLQVCCQPLHSLVLLCISIVRY